MCKPPVPGIKSIPWTVAIVTIPAILGSSVEQVVMCLGSSCMMYTHIPAVSFTNSVTLGEVL